MHKKNEWRTGSDQYVTSITIVSVFLCDFSCLFVATFDSALYSEYATKSARENRRDNKTANGRERTLIDRE